MKKVFFICFIAVSALALSTSAHSNYHFASVNVSSDTTPTMMSDNMQHSNMKMHKKGKMMKDSSSTSGMGMKADSTSTAPPKK